MSEFYTNVFLRGDRVLVRGYENGQAYSRRIDFSPTLYVDSKNKTPTKFKTLNGDFVSEIKPGTIRETRDFVSRYDEVDGFNVYGNTNYVCQYISDTYLGREVEWDMDQIKLFSIDIETATENGFPDIASANEEVLLITIQDNVTKQITTFGSRPYENKNTKVNYVQCNGEQHLLREFMLFWQQNYPDAITGWNVNLFDVPYLVKRVSLMLGDTISNKFSPWGVVNERKIYIKGKEEISYDIAGIAVLDYLDLYKKFTYTKQESYRLDYIAEAELGENKKVNPTNGDFKSFYSGEFDVIEEPSEDSSTLIKKAYERTRIKFELQRRGLI